MKERMYKNEEFYTPRPSLKYQDYFTHTQFQKILYSEAIPKDTSRGSASHSQEIMGKLQQKDC